MTPTRALTRRLVVLAALLLCAVAPPVGALAADSAKDAVRGFRDAWRQGIPKTILLALEDLAAFDSPVCVDALLDVFDTGRAAFFPSARHVLAGYSAAESVEVLVRVGVGSRDPRVREQAIRVLGEGRPTSHEWIAPTLAALDDPSPAVRAAAVAALGRARADGALDAVVDLAADASERVRKEVPEALARLAGERALPLLRSLARDERWRVRLGVVRALADIKSPKSVEELVELLAREEGRVREDCLERLQRLTGRAFGLDVDAWRRFLAEAPDDFITRADKMMLQPPKYAGGLRYYGVKTLSKRFVLVTDVSGSMETPVDVRSIYEGTAPRITITIRELVRLIGELEDDVSFDLVTFSDAARWWKPSLVRATARNKRNAVAVVEGYRASGATNVHEALAFVFDMAEEALDAPVAKNEDLDTVFLLSDGVPTEGAIQSADLLVDYIAERNGVLDLRIHCLSLTDEPQAESFLQRIAERSGGRYVRLVAD